MSEIIAEQSRPDHQSRIAAAARRRERVANRFKRLLIADQEDVSWLLGRHQSPSRKSSLWVDDGRWRYLAFGPEPVDVTPDVEVIEVTAETNTTAPDEALGRTLVSLVGAQRFVLAGDPTLMWLAPLTGRFTDSGDVLAAVRSSKDKVEQALIADNAARLGRALEGLREMVRPGRSELELWSALGDELESPPGDSVEIAGNVASGMRTLEPDPHPIDRRIEAGDALLLDAYPRIGGYHADLTRTWGCAPVNPQLQSIYDAVLAALGAVATRLRPGALGGELDRVARAELERHGWPGNFSHHTGHGFGVKQQEPPWLRPGSDDVIEPGFVIAVEPGCYREGLGGVRLEQNFLVLDEATVELGPPIASYRFAAT